MEVLALAILVSILGGILPALVNRFYARPLQQQLELRAELPCAPPRSWFNRILAAQDFGLPNWIPGTVERFCFFLLAYADGPSAVIVLAAIVWLSVKNLFRWYPLFHKASDMGVANAVAVRSLVALISDALSLGTAIIFGALEYEPPGKGLRFQ